MRRATKQWFDLFERSLDRVTVSGPRSSTTRGRTLESGVHLNQLLTIGGRQLRILEPGNGATEDDVGKFWFVIGYSRVGGPDIIPID